MMGLCWCVCVCVVCVCVCAFVCVCGAGVVGACHDVKTQNSHCPGKPPLKSKELKQKAEQRSPRSSSRRHGKGM